MLRLTEANLADAAREWAFVRDMPEDENGLINDMHGITREAFLGRGLPRMLAFARGEGLPEGYVPETFFFLWKDDEIIGQYRVRHFLCESLRTGAGHIGYFIAKPWRGRGYGTEDEIYLRVNRDNPASLRVMLKNGGRVVSEDDAHFFVRIPKIRSDADRGPSVTGEPFRESI